MFANPQLSIWLQLCYRRAQLTTYLGAIWVAYGREDDKFFQISDSGRLLHRYAVVFVFSRADCHGQVVQRAAARNLVVVCCEGRFGHKKNFLFMTLRLLNNCLAMTRVFFMWSALDTRHENRHSLPNALSARD